jgi:hypothetical protein
MLNGSGITVEVDTLFRDQGFRAAAKGAKTVGDAADIAAKQLRDMDAKLEAADTKARKLAQAEEQAAERARRLAQDLALAKRQLSESGDESGKLSRRIERLATDHRFAAVATEEYRRAANKAADVAREQARAYDRVADNARQAARAVAMLGAAATFSPDGKGGFLAGAGQGAGMLARLGSSAAGGLTSLGEGATGLIGGSGPAGAIAAGVAVPAALAAGTFVGAAAGGGALAGAGLGAAGAGLAGAWMGDPGKYGAQWNAMIDKVQKRWIDSSKAFTKELDSDLKIVGHTLEALPIERVLAVTHGLSTPIVAGLGAGTINATSGLAAALDKVKPIVDQVGPELAELGHKVGDAFRMISEGSEGGGHALEDFITVAGKAVQIAGLMVLGFEKAYEGIRDFATGVDSSIRNSGTLGVMYEGLKSSLFGVGETAIVTGQKLSGTGDSSSRFASSLMDGVRAGAAATDQAKALNDSLTDLHKTMLASADANLAVAQGWLDLNEGLKEGAKTLDLTKQAGIDNQKVILSQMELIERQREQAVSAAGDSAEAIDAANRKYAEQVERIRQAAYAAGFDKQKVDELITSLDAVPPDTKGKVSIDGLKPALDQGISLGNALNRIDGQTYVADVIVRYGTQGQSRNVPLRTGGIRGAAIGGIQDGLTRVGEDGEELVRMPTGAMVYSTPTSRQLNAQFGRQQQPLMVELRVTGSGELYELLHKAQRAGQLQIFNSAIVG